MVAQQELMSTDLVLLARAADYAARVALPRDQIRAETDRLGWLFSTHNTGRTAAELLLFLHGGMMVSKGSARTSQVKAGHRA